MPYLAVILDSFRSALASRILWIALLAIWLCLAALALMGVREKYRTTFTDRDFYNGTRMKAMLAQGTADPALADKPLGRMAAALPGGLATQLQRVADGDEVRIELSKFSDAFNDMLRKEDWYSESAWSDVVRLRELRELDEADDDSLSRDLRWRRARLRIESALPGVFRSRSARSIVMTYAGIDFPTFMEIDKTRFAMLINQFVLPFLISSLLGAVLVFLGVLVTASIVPDMLQPGSLHLLLSKPISRPLLLLSKFTGGCAFVLLCVTQLVGGIWLIAGLRLDIWNLRVLWCIPTSVFLFTVYYSVSVYAGLRWRSSILAIGVTCFFGAICFVVGFVGGIFDGNISRPDRISHVVTGGDTLMGATDGGTVVHFDRLRNRWAQVVDGKQEDRVLGPIHVSGDTFVTANVPSGRRNPYGSGALDLQVARPLPDGTEATKAERKRIALVQQAEGNSVVLSRDWQAVPSLRLPTATGRLFRFGDDQLMAINGSGVFVCDFDAIQSKVDQKETEKADGELTNGWLMNLMSMQGASTEDFQSILPKEVSVIAPTRVAIAPQAGSILFASHGTVSMLRPTGESKQPWKVCAKHVFETDASKPIVAAVGRSVVAVARPDEPLTLMNRETLEIAKTISADSTILTIDFLPPPKSSNSTSARPPAFVLHDAEGTGRVFTETGEVIAELPQSEIESLVYDSDRDSLYVVHHIDSVDVMDASDWSITETLRPDLATWRSFDRYVLTPLRTIVPKTGELSGAVSNLVGGKSSFVVGQDESGDGMVLRSKLAPPLISCSLFIAFMLTLSCVYFARHDF